MAYRPFRFSVSEHYHCYNRGVDKRTIFKDNNDYLYFINILHAFNTSEVLGKMRLHQHRPPIDPPVTILSYCLLPNHYHLLLRCNDEVGFSKYMQRIGGGYTMYFNKKNKRSGSLFQGKFKAKHIETDQDLRQILAYVQYNYLVHNTKDKKLYRTQLNTDDSLVRGLSSNFDKNKQKEVVDIIKEMRSSRKDLEL